MVDYTLPADAPPAVANATDAAAASKAMSAAILAPGALERWRLETTAEPSVPLHSSQRQRSSITIANRLPVETPTSTGPYGPIAQPIAMVSGT